MLCMPVRYDQMCNDDPFLDSLDQFQVIFLVLRLVAESNFEVIGIVLVAFEV